MKSSYINRAIKFLDTILPYIQSDMMSPDSMDDIIHDYNKINHRRICVCHGATRIALITSDYVIKWDYNKRAIRSWGGNKQEAEIYEIAKKAGYSYLLAELTTVERNGIVFNIMPRFSTGRSRPHISKKVSNKEWHWLYRHIGDVHSGNYTMVKGAPIIFDYACKA